MPRPPRIHLEGALYYVTSRAEPTLPLFKDQKDVDTYLDLLAEYKARHSFKLFAYALAPDQVHLCLETAPGTTVSQIMHDLNSRYTKLYCKRHDWSGHLFQGRFRAVVAEKEMYLLRLTHYLHAQPEALANSLSHYKAREFSWVDVKEGLDRFEAGNPGKNYEEFVQAAAPEELERLRRILQQPIIGSPEFIQRSRKQPQEEEPTQAPESEPEEKELELVPVPVRRRAHLAHLRSIFSVVALLGLIYSTSLIASLSMKAMTLAGKPVQVVLQGGTPITQASASATGVPAAQMATFAISSYLNGTSWNLQIKPMQNAGQADVQTDRLQFDEKKVTSTRLSTQGFTGSNYTVTPQPNGTFIWETMQTGSNGDIVCWRGEWDGQEMRGIVSRHPVKEAPQDFVFKGTKQDSKDSGRTL